MLRPHNFELDVFFSTIRVESVDDFGHDVFGTAFVFDYKVRDGVRFKLLVSNKHVLCDPSCIRLRMHRRVPGQSEADYTRGIVIEEDLTEHYMEHPSPTVDLACINISHITKREEIFWRGVNSEMFLDFESPKLLPGQDVWFVGYPDGRYDIPHNLPILRRGSMASIPWVDFYQMPQFLIDAHVYPGSSGSPVFATTNKKARLAGVLTEVVIKRGGIVPARGALKEEDDIREIGIGLVLKHQLITQMVEANIWDYIKRFGDPEDDVIEER